jgi:hypothetical protein
MPFNIQEFRSEVDNRGMMRTNKFLVDFPVPPKLAPGILTGGSRSLSMYCKSAPLPGIGLLTQDIYRYGYGPIERRPYGTVVNDIMFQFYVDGDNLIRGWFRNWIRLIINPDSAKGINSTFTLTGQNAYELSYKEDYAADIRITSFTPEGTPKISVVLIEAYPNFVGDVVQDWDHKQQNMILPVAFTFRDWYEDSIPGTNSGTQTALVQSKPLSTPTLAPQPKFFNPNVDLDTSGAMPIGVPTKFGIRI